MATFVLFAPNQRQSSCFSSRTSSLTTTMLITFNPPVGDTIRIARPALFPLTQPIVLLFTAQLSAHDYNDLVQQEARVELWSDLPRDQESGWGKLEFSESWNDSALDCSSQIQGNQVKTLDISVPIPAATSATCRFSFTYRITYTSGHITWLGAFGQDGLLIFEHNAVYGLVLRQGWREDDTQESRVFEIPEGISSTEVAKVENPSNFRIWALGKDGWVLGDSVAIPARILIRMKVHTSSRQCFHPFLDPQRPDGFSYSQSNIRHICITKLVHYHFLRRSYHCLRSGTYPSSNEQYCFRSRFIYPTDYLKVQA